MIGERTIAIFKIFAFDLYFSPIYRDKQLATNAIFCEHISRLAHPSRLPRMHVIWILVMTLGIIDIGRHLVGPGPILDSGPALGSGVLLALDAIIVGSDLTTGVQFNRHFEFGRITGPHS